MSATASGAKACVRCHKDLTGHRRLKDHRGQYWCADCGKADNALRHPEGALVPQSGHCHDCHGRYPAPNLHPDGDDTVCTGCLAGREKERRLLTAPPPTAARSGGPAERVTIGFTDRVTGRAVAVCLAVAAILAGAWWLGRV